jgi:pyridoxamine 5'-phosphate oxidase
MVIHLRRLACLFNIIRPTIEGEFLIERSRTTSFVDNLARNQLLFQRRMTMEPSSTGNTDCVSLQTTNVGQQDIGRQITDVQFNGVGDGDVTEKEDSADVVVGNGGDETFFIHKSWREYLEISIAKTRKIRGSNYVQIATVDSSTNEPRCRTVVFRGFLNVPTTNTTRLDASTSFLVNPITNQSLSCIMKMCTDLRSEKVHQTGPTEVVWWFPKTSEQYRIRGTMILIGNDNSTEQDRDLIIARKEMWGSLTDASRESFLATQCPGDIYSNETNTVAIEQDRRYGGRDANDKVIQPPPNTFLLMLVIPSRCDYLNLSNMFRQIDTLSNGKWQAQRVNA